MKRTLDEKLAALQRFLRSKAGQYPRSDPRGLLSWHVSERGLPAVRDDLVMEVTRKESLKEILKESEKKGGIW